MKKFILTPKEKKAILENFLSLSTQQGVAYFLPVIILPYLIRVIGAEKFGLLAFAQAFAQYFMILTDYGFNLSATREIALSKLRQERILRIFSAVMAVKIALLVLGLAVLLATISIVPRFKQEQLVFLISFGAVIGYALFPVWLFQGKEQMKYIAIINISGGIIYAVLIFAFVRSPADYLKVAVLNSLFFLVTGTVGLLVAFRKFALRFRIGSAEDLLQQLKSGWHVFISILAINGYTATRVFAVGLLTNNTITGFYAVAERIANFIQTFPLLSLSQAVYPRFSKIFQKNKQRALKLLRKLQGSITIIYAIIILTVMYLSPFIAKIFCGKSSGEVRGALQLLLVGVFFVVANAFRVQFLLVCGKSHLYSKLHVYAALLGIPFLFILTGYFSYLGAAFSTVVIEAGVLISTVILVRKILRRI